MFEQFLKSGDYAHMNLGKRNRDADFIDEDELVF